MHTLYHLSSFCCRLILWRNVSVDVARHQSPAAWRPYDNYSSGWWLQTSSWCCFWLFLSSSWSGCLSQVNEWPVSIVWCHLSEAFRYLPVCSLVQNCQLILDMGNTVFWSYISLNGFIVEFVVVLVFEWGFFFVFFFFFFFQIICPLLQLVEFSFSHHCLSLLMFLQVLIQMNQSSFVYMSSTMIACIIYMLFATVESVILHALMVIMCWSSVWRVSSSAFLATMNCSELWELC